MLSEQELANSGPAYIYVDGGSQGNPGPSAIAYIIKSPDQETTLAKKAKYIGETTNNVTEYTAILEALKHAHKLGIRKVLIRSDSELIVKQLKGLNKIKSPKLLPLFLACQSEIDEFAVFAIEHIPRAENTEADKMVRDAIKAHVRAGTSASKCSFKPDGIIYVAGGSKGSPGHAAAAYVIVTPSFAKASAGEPDDLVRPSLGDGGKVVAIYARYLGKRLPNIPEYAAVYLSAKKAQSLGLSKVVIRSDNTLVARQLSGEFKVKSEKLKKPYAECVQALSDFEKYAIQSISRAANKITYRMVSETIKDYVKQEAESRVSNKKGNPAAATVVQDSELDS